MITTDRYTIGRPPLHKNFQLPNRDDLLALRIGDFVKLTFVPDQGDMPERMWVKITAQDAPDLWRGVLSNIPFDSEAFSGLHGGDAVSFHPLDSIDLGRS